ncbi:hypothetical protein FACS1894216_19520 [Synergistales bacterium]|nr:hypothetical protein FACS1894216_19520 [Synergistales bacterium]
MELRFNQESGYIEWKHLIVEQVYSGDDLAAKARWYTFGPGTPVESPRAVKLAEASAHYDEIVRLNEKRKPEQVQTADPRAVKPAYADPKAISSDILGGNYTMTSGYDAKRDRGKRQHSGYDFAAPKGTPIKAPGVIGEGYVVKAAGSDKSRGNHVVISGPGGAEWEFNHMQSEPELAKGDAVAPGMELGKVGNTGSVIAGKGSDGTHLDVKFRVNGKLTDPVKYFGSGKAAQAAKPAGAAKQSADMTREQIMALPPGEQMDYLDSLEED